jgi:hypothetical protein
MKFGPFESFIIDRLKRELDKRNIPFAVSSDEDELKREERQFHDRADVMPFNPGFKYTGRAFYIDIEDNYLAQLDKDLENYGIIAHKDSNETSGDLEAIKIQDQGDIRFLGKLGGLLFKLLILCSAALLIYVLIKARSG